MIDIITDFKGLEEHIENSGFGYREAVLDYYKKLGIKHGFSVRENSSVIRYGINFGRIDLIWLEPNTTFTIEFGNLEEILKHLWRIMEFTPELAVLLLSSKSGCKATDVIKVIKNSPVLKEMRDRILAIDLTDKEVIYSTG